MVFVYIRIYFAAKARARRGIRKPQRPRAQQEKCTSFTTTTAATSSSAAATTATASVATATEDAVTLELPPGVAISTIAAPRPMAIPIVTCDFASDISTSDNAEPPADDAPKDTLKVACAAPAAAAQGCQRLGANLSANGDPAVVTRCRAPSVGIDADMVSEFDPSSSDSGVVSRCAVVKPLKMRLCQPIFGRRAASKSKSKSDDGGGGATPSNAGGEAQLQQQQLQQLQQQMQMQPPPKIQKPRDPVREKRRLARKKEKRATLILGLIMGSFIACWLPFFFLYILVPSCAACSVPDVAFAIAFWLGYMNSALNPVIYTIFNKDFRRAFRRILFK
ncbi:5-hydroxytryptamine receptor 2A-like [Bacillus rossius redtenbacheri]|uniref:5-hydroxytryptamine receptor 2A-like n=1 Tax=Bacillus rossius redtenbacheri TaxID=93214 RepID=UPI002FDE51A7